MYCAASSWVDCESVQSNRRDSTARGGRHWLPTEGSTKSAFISSGPRNHFFPDDVDAQFPPNTHLLSESHRAHLNFYLQLWHQPGTDKYTHDICRPPWVSAVRCSSTVPFHTYLYTLMYGHSIRERLHSSHQREQAQWENDAG